MVNQGNADHEFAQMQNIYHRYIKLPFSFKKPEWSDVKRTFSKEQESGSEYFDINEKGDTDVYRCDIKENDDNVRDFFDKFNLFFDSKLLFYTKGNDTIKIHVDSNKDEPYSKRVDNYLDNHAKLNFTWETKDSSLRWWKCKNDTKFHVDKHTYKEGKAWQVIWADPTDCEMVYEKRINKPSIVNTGQLHSTHNQSKEGRITLSYNLVKKHNLELVTFSEALWLFGDLLYE